MSKLANYFFPDFEPGELRKFLLLSIIFAFIIGAFAQSGCKSLFRRIFYYLLYSFVFRSFGRLVSSSAIFRQKVQRGC